MTMSDKILNPKWLLMGRVAWQPPPLVYEYLNARVNVIQ